MEVQVSPKALAYTLESEASRFNCTPQQLALTLLECCLQSAIVDAVLDGADPKESYRTDGTAVPKPKPLSKHQHLLFSYLAGRADPVTAIVSIGPTEIGKLLHWPFSRARSTLDALVNKRLLQRLNAGCSTAVTPQFKIRMTALEHL